jgi:hypothetical protein
MPRVILTIGDKIGKDALQMTLVALVLALVTGTRTVGGTCWWEQGGNSKGANATAISSSVSSGEVLTEFLSEFQR